jgi:hypothetical protein
MTPTAEAMQRAAGDFMGKRGAILGVGLLLLAAHAAAASAEIFRCTAPDGAVTYQQIPCPSASSERPVDVPASYPGFDPAERERLFDREAALDRRLEARRERESREAIAAQASRAQQAKAQASEPAYFLAGPIAPILRLPHGPRRPHRWLQVIGR